MRRRTEQWAQLDTVDIRVCIRGACLYLLPICSVGMWDECPMIKLQSFHFFYGIMAIKFPHVFNVMCLMASDERWVIKKR